MLAGRSTVLVGGPAGVGKSTELAQAARHLQADRVACLVSVDLWENMRRITPDRLLLRIAAKLVHLAVVQLRLPVSQPLRAMLWHAGVLPEELVEHAGAGHPEAPAIDLARMALNEVTRLSRQGRTALILDGLEKVPEGPLAPDLFDALGPLAELADLVTVVPWHVAFGPQAAESLVRAGERFIAVRAPEVVGERGRAGREFLRAILERRLDLPAGALAGDVSDRSLGEQVPANIPDLMIQAAVLSGGLPRTFLQLAGEAGINAKLRRRAPWPDATDLADAIADQQDSLRRILLPGDKALLKRFDGSDGLEMDPAAKVRMLAQGLLLERQEDAGVTLRMHPLVVPVVGDKTDA